MSVPASTDPWTEASALVQALSSFAWPVAAFLGFVIFKAGLGGILEAIAEKIRTMKKGSVQRGKTRVDAEWPASSDARARRRVATEHARRAKLREVKDLTARQR